MGDRESFRLISLYRKRTKWYDRDAVLLYFAGFRHWSYRRRAIQSLTLKRGDTVVDLGCGTGLNFPLLEEQAGPPLVKHRTGQMRRCVYVFPTAVDGILSTFALTLVPQFKEVIRKGAQALIAGKPFVILDFKNLRGGL